MPKQNRVSKQTSQQSQFTPQSSQLRSRPFTLEVQAQETTEQQSLEDIKTQREQQSRLGHNFADITLGTSTPPPTLNSFPIQAKLTIGKPNDKYEQEADRVAADVVQRMNSSPTQGNVNTLQRSDNGKLQRQQIEDEDELQRKPNRIQLKANNLVQGNMIQADFESTLNRAKGSGSSLDSAFRAKVEPAMGADFSGVKVHTDATANHLSQSIQAKAFTTGKDIFFKQGEYNPGSRGGQELLAHELTHVVQQNSGVVQRQSWIQRDDSEPQETMLGQAIAGVKKESENKKVTTGLGSVTNTETKTEALAGAEAAVKKITQASDESVKTAFEAMARAGAFGEVTAKKYVERESVSYGAEGKASGMAGAQADAKLSVEVCDVIEGIKILAEASAKAGISGDLEGKIRAAAGPLAGELSAKINVFAGVMAEAKGELNISLLAGIVASGSVKVKAGASSEGEITANISLAELGIEGKGEYEALAGAEAGAEGKVQISMFGVSASGKAEAFAGAKVKGTGSTSLVYKGKILIKLSGEVEAAAGVGGSVEGEFTFHKGKLVISGQAAAVLGIGTGAGLKAEVDFYAIGEAIVDIVKRAVSTKAKINRLSLPDDDREYMPVDKAAEINQALYDAVYPKFKAYADKKAARVAKGKAQNFVKREKIQKIIDDKILTQSPYQDWIKYKESDLVLTQAAYDAFGEQLNEGGFVIQAGIIRGFDVKKTGKEKPKDIKKLF